LPMAFADTFGNSSTAGMSTFPGSSGTIYPARFTAPSSGTLSSISFFVAGVSGSVTGNVGIYADSSGSLGSLLAQGTAQTLSNGVNTFSSLSASVSIVASTNYWLAFEMAGGSFYYGGTGLRGWASATCCTMPSTVTLSGTAPSSYAIYATYSTGPPPPSTYSFNVRTGATQVVVTASWTGTSGTASVTIAGPGGTPTLSESGAVIYDRVSYVSGSSTPTYIHRVTFTLTSPPTGTWTASVSQTSATVTIEVS
jgi:hypothetical protein